MRQLRAQGPPPYDSLWDYEVALSHERDWNHYPRMPAYESQGEMPANLFVREYSLLGKLRALGAFLDTFSVLYPQLREVDLRRSATSLDVPVFMVEGRHEARGRLGPAGEWFDALQAPEKQRFDFPRAGHRPHFERPADVCRR